MSEKGHIVYVENRKTVLHKYRDEQKMLKANSQKEVSTKLMKGLLDLIILQILNTQPMHGYQVITKIRKSFGVYFGPSTIYPLLGILEKKGFAKSEWNMTSERPRKIYSLTNNGQNTLNFTEESLNLICRKITTQPNAEITLESSAQPMVSMIARRGASTPRNPLAVQVG
jgi:PadR family transcriptional regulator PadR